jgi:hypothetical protein
MRSLKILVAAIVAVIPSVSAQTSANCTFDAKQVRSVRELWHQLSVDSERLAPSAAATSRRRAAVPRAGTFSAVNFIDAEIFGKMVKDGIVWTTTASDEEFLRRVTLDLTGSIPDAETVKTFVKDASPNKREAAIDRLLASEGFTDRWTMWFGDLVQNVQFSQASAMYYPARNAYYQFIRNSVAANKPYDQMVRDIIAGAGNNFIKGEANYWVRNIQSNGPIQDTYDNLSANSGEIFLGLPLVCLSCHSGLAHLELVNSGLANRTRMDFWKNAAFFAQVTARGEVDPATETLVRSVEDNTTGGYRLNTISGNKTPRQPASGESNVVEPAFFLSAETPQPGETRRQAYGRILTAHPQFARATVNYLWKTIFGLGIVEPADSFDLRRQDPAQLVPGASLQPTHPVLLTRLSDHFVATGFDLRAFLKTIVMSNTYQLSARYAPGEWNEAWTPYFARRNVRRLMAEALFDSIVLATGVGAQLNVLGFDPVPKAMKLPDPTEGRQAALFLNAFGRGDRDDQKRTSESSIAQALLLLNDRTITERVKARNNSTVQKVTTATSDKAAIADALYLATLSRYPTAAERLAAVEYLGEGNLVERAEDLQYALLNRVDFLFY